MTLLDTLQTTPDQLIPAAGDGNTFNLLTNSDTPAILLDATLATKTLLAEENPGLLTISEYAKFLRDMQLKKTTPLIADMQSGFGNPLNTFYAAQELERSGGDILMLNDQTYPAHNLERPTTTTPADLLGKARAAKDSLENPATQLWIKLEGIWDYGIEGAQQRMHYLANAGTDAIIIDHYTTSDLQALVSSEPELPLLATWNPDTTKISGIAGWLDTGCLADKALQAQQTALQNLLKEDTSYAEK